MFRSKFIVTVILFFACQLAYTQMPPFGFWKTGGVKPFQVLGAVGGTDATADAWFADSGNILNISWQNTTEDSFDVTVYENDETTVKCGLHNVAQDTLSFSFAISTDCVSSLTEGTTYKAKVVAKKSTKDYRAVNSMYAFAKDTVPPTINITGFPANPTNQTAANFTFTVSDATSGVNTIECFLDTISQGACANSKNFTGLADGNHEFKVVAVDNAGNSAQATYNWNINTIVITGDPLYYTQISTAWSQGLTVSGGTGSFTYSLPVNPGGDSAVSASPTVSYTTGATAGAFNFTLRVTDTISGNTKDFSFVLDSYDNDLCLWTGGTSTDWATASNWLYCSGSAPIATSKVAILSTAANMPTISVNTTIDSFGLGPGGGTITINAGRVLTLDNTTQTVRSSVIMKGQNPTCTNCTVITTVANPNLSIVDGAVFEIEAGIKFGNGGGGFIRVGDGVTHGSLKTSEDGSGHKPLFIMNGSSNFIVVNGTAANRSVVDIHGLIADGQQSRSGSYFYFQDYYEIKNMDGVTKLDEQYSINSGHAIFRFASCVNALVTDTSWTDMIMNVGVEKNIGYNIRADGASCGSLPVITIANAPTPGQGYGSFYELDPNNKISWLNDSSHLCEWSGAISTDWNNAGNWSSCNNGRGGVPIGEDSAVIPGSPLNQPLISTNTYLRNFGLGMGGGTVTVGAGARLTIADTTNTIQSDVKFQGATTTCANCVVSAASFLTITDNATVTLLKGIQFRGQGIRVGNGSSGGAIKTGPAGPANEWPLIYSNVDYVTLEGGDTSNRAILSLDGANVGAYNVGFFNFKKFSEIQNFDNVYFQTSSMAGDSNIRFSDCNGVNILDSAWTAIHFRGVPSHALGYNIRADGSNCNLLPTVTISSSGTDLLSGYGSLYENDPYNKFNWTNGASYTCEWTGAADSSWTNAANWNSCANGRFGYPDALDSAVIPVTATQPVISSNTNLFAIGAGTGGGTVTINSGVAVRLVANTDTIRSDVKFQGNTTTCTTCQIQKLHMTNEDLQIVNNSTLTLLSGIYVFAGQGKISVGNGVEAGHLATGAAGAPNEWPSVYVNKNLSVNGTVGQNSSVNFDGINLGLYFQAGGRSIIFGSYSTISKFDNITFDYPSGTSLTDASYVHFSNCTGMSVTDTSWAGLTFADSITGSARNIDASGTSCSSLPTISLTGYSGTGACGAVGSGACTYENDPNSKIDWN